MFGEPLRAQNNGESHFNPPKMGASWREESPSVVGTTAAPEEEETLDLGAIARLKILKKI